MGRNNQGPGLGPRVCPAAEQTWAPQCCLELPDGPSQERGTDCAMQPKGQDPRPGRRLLGRKRGLLGTPSWRGTAERSSGSHSQRAQSRRAHRVHLSLSVRRRADAVRPAQREAEGLRRLQPQDQGPLPVEGSGQVLARGLPQVRLLRLPPGRGGLHPLHQGQPHPVPPRLPEVGRLPPLGPSAQRAPGCGPSTQSAQPECVLSPDCPAPALFPHMPAEPPWQGHTFNSWDSVASTGPGQASVTTGT